MNCIRKTTQANTFTVAAVDELLPSVFQFSVHGVGISIFNNSSFIFGL